MGNMYSRWYAGSLVIYPGDSGPGTEFFVDSTNGLDTNTGLDWINALATIDAANDKCTASNGDKIIVAPFHTEDLAADSAIDLDTEGVTVVGVNFGRQMPTLNATATAGDCKLAAANVTVSGIRFTGGIDATTGIVEVSGADCALIGCEYRDVTGQATDVITTVDGSDRLLIDGFTCFGAAGAGGNSAIAVDGSDDIIIRNCYIHGNFAVGAIDFRTTLSARMNVHDCKIWTTNAADIAIVDTITGSTGFIGPNIQAMLADDAANITEAITAATCQMVDPIYIVNLAGQKALLTNIAASSD